jgi:hypothetical protein
MKTIKKKKKIKKKFFKKKKEKERKTPLRAESHHDRHHNGRDKLCLKRAGAAWTSSVPIPALNIPIQNTLLYVIMLILQCISFLFWYVDVVLSVNGLLLVVPSTFHVAMLV